jgi:octaprenyl-diphosphate synthase
MATVDKMTTGQFNQQPSADVVIDPATLMRDMLLLIAEPLGQVEEVLYHELQDDAPFVGDLLEYVAGLGGKRMRPCLVLLTAQATGEVRKEHITLAAVVEMIHTATLVHDDILDGADTRRHKETVNTRWGNQAAVLLGDYLFTHAFFLASTVGTEACQVIGKSTNRVCAGEMKQVGQRGNLALTEAEYFDIIRGKTAELCACCCELGASYSGATPEVVAAVKQFGMQVGTAFQIADDVLDLQGDPSQTGKSLGTDLVNQKMTLPAIHALAKLEQPARDELLAQLASGPTADAIQTLRDAIDRFESVAYAKGIATGLIDEAVCSLDGLPDSPAKQSLVAMARFVLTRSS